MAFLKRFESFDLLIIFIFEKIVDKNNDEIKQNFEHKT